MVGESEVEVRGMKTLDAPRTGEPTAVVILVENDPLLITAESEAETVVILG